MPYIWKGSDFDTQHCMALWAQSVPHINIPAQMAEYYGGWEGWWLLGGKSWKCMAEPLRRGSWAKGFWEVIELCLMSCPLANVWMNWKHKGEAINRKGMRHWSEGVERVAQWETGGGDRKLPKWRDLWEIKGVKPRGTEQTCANRVSWHCSTCVWRTSFSSLTTTASATGSLSDFLLWVSFICAGRTLTGLVHSR